MGNDRDERFEGHEESEYHFSDEEANYEMEAETSKSASAVVPEPKENILARLTRSKRMLISLGVFLVLVFVVYKMVTPSSSIPSTDISTPPAQPKPASVNIQASSLPSNQTTTPVVPPIPGAMVQQQTSPSPIPNQPGGMPVSQATTTPQVGTIPASVTPSLATVAMPPSGASLMSPPQPIGAASTSSTVSLPPTQQPVIPATVVTVATQTLPAQTATVPTPGAMLPTRTESQTSTPVVAPTTVMGTKVDQQTAVLTADVDKLMTQLQTTYAQKIDDYSNQTKELHEQVRVLNSKVVNIENQLNQLVQMLTRQQSFLNNSAPPAPRPVVEQAPRVAYNVQAIIPGRAWLKSDSGETLTVAEGDLIKDVGRVTKIDPYDGLVEINTGNKIISLSYGNGG